MGKVCQEDHAVIHDIAEVDPAIGLRRHFSKHRLPRSSFAGKFDFDWFFISRPLSIFLLLTTNMIAPTKNYVIHPCRKHTIFRCLTRSEVRINSLCISHKALLDVLCLCLASSRLMFNMLISFSSRVLVSIISLFKISCSSSSTRRSAS